MKKVTLKTVLKPRGILFRAIYKHNILCSLRDISGNCNTGKGSYRFTAKYKAMVDSETQLYTNNTVI